MKGSVKIIVSTKRLHYELTLRRNITIIQGDSATGKTTLIQILADYLAGRTGPGTEVICDRKCAVLSGDAESAIARLKTLKETVVFVDEQERFLYSQAFAEAVLNSDCYFVLITRDGLNMLPYSVNEIYCLRNSGYYQNTRRIYNSMHQIYPERKTAGNIEPSVVLTEDSNSGYEMYETLFSGTSIICTSADGKSNIAKYILSNVDKPIFAVVDGAAFGADMQGAMHALEVNQQSFVWTPESFEYLILQSGIVKFEGLKEILEAPEDYIDSGAYCSWERYFTWLLEDSTKNTIYVYNKSKINPNFLTKGNLEKMKKILPEVLGKE